MDYLFICNMSSDYVSKVNLSSFKEEKITLANITGRVGPQGICTWKSYLIVANSFSNSISKIDIVQGKEVDNFYIGTHCTGAEVFEDEAYVICGESNTIVTFDLQTNKIIEEVPSGNHPHSIAINKKNGMLAVANMESDSVTLLDCRNKDYSKEIKVGPYPTKVLFSKDGKYIYVCESCLGCDKTGAVSLLSLNNLSIEHRIYTGKAPMDMCCENEICYVSNFNEGTISIIYLEDKEQVKKLNLGGMPWGIAKKGRYVYIGDNYGNLLLKYDIYNEKIKTVPIGMEPVGMIIV